MAHTVEWQTGICDCGKDCTICFITCIFPCVTFGEIASALIERDPNNQCDMCFIQGAIYWLLSHIPCCVVTLYTYRWRTKLRNRYNLKGTPFEYDLLTHCFCLCCALCQERRELKVRQPEGVAAHSSFTSTVEDPMAAPDVNTTQMVRWWSFEN